MSFIFYIMPCYVWTVLHFYRLSEQGFKPNIVRVY
jgi:hypothetical protein